MKTITIPIPEGFQIDSLDKSTGEIKLVPVPKDIKEVIKTFDDVLNYFSIPKKEFDEFVYSDFVLLDEVAYRQLKLIASALNEGWEPDWDNTDQRKYYPWFNMASGGFSYGGYDDGWTYSTVGSRLCFKSEELAKYAAETFTHIYKNYFLINKINNNGKD